MKIVFSYETAKGCLLVDGMRIVGHPNNRVGRRAYEKGLRHGKGFFRIPEPEKPKHPLLELSAILNKIEIARLAPPLRDLTEEQIEKAIDDDEAQIINDSVVPRMVGGAQAWFWVGGTGVWDNVTTTHWAATSGGVGGAGVPAAGDTVTFDGSSGLAGATVTANTSVVPAVINWSSGIATSTATLTMTQALNCTGTFTFAIGTLITNSKNCSWGVFSSSTVNVRTFTFGASSITLTGTGTVWNTSTGTNLTMTANTAQITLSGNAATFTTATNQNLNGASLTVAGSGTNSMNGPFIVTNFTYQVVTPTVNDTLSLPQNFTCTSTFTVNGSATFYPAVLSNTFGTPRTITAAVTNLTNVLFRDITAAGVATWTGTLVGNMGGNTGITFTPSATQSYVGGVKNWGDVTAWSGRRPLPQDDVTINTAGGTLTVNTPNLGRTLNFTGFTGTFTFATNPNFFGGITLAAGMTFTAATFAANFIGRNGNYVINTAGKGWNGGVTVNAPGSSFSLASNLTLGSGGGNTDFILQNGTFTDAGFNIVCDRFRLDQVGTRTLTFAGGSYTMRLGGTGIFWIVANTANLTINRGTGTSIIQTSWPDGSTATKTFQGGNFSYPTLKGNTAAGGNHTIAITGNNTFYSLNFGTFGSARTVSFPAGGTQIVTGPYIAQGAAGVLLSLVSSVARQSTTITVQNGDFSNLAFVSQSNDIVYTGRGAQSLTATTTMTGHPSVDLGQGVQSLNAISTMTGSGHLIYNGSGSLSADSEMSGSPSVLASGGRENLLATSTMAGFGFITIPGPHVNFIAVATMAGIGKRMIGNTKLNSAEDNDAGALFSTDLNKAQRMIGAK